MTVHDTNPGLGAYNPIGIPVIVVGTNIAAGTVVDLTGGPIVKGLFDYDIYLRPDKVYVLASTPNAAANELPRLITAAQDVWHQEAGVWADRSSDLRAYFTGRGAVRSADGHQGTVHGTVEHRTRRVGTWLRRLVAQWRHRGRDALRQDP